MKIQKLIIAAVLSLAIYSCTSSIKKADISNSANAAEEIAKLDRSTSQAYANQVDVLAPMEFELSTKKLSQAKKDLADGDDREDVIESIAFSKAYLDRANELAATRREKAASILESRQKAIDAGAKSYGPTAKQLEKADDELSSYSTKFEKLSAKDVAVLQKDYADIELAAVENKQLGRAKNLIESAKDKNASRHAPDSLKKAEIDFQTAQGVVRANRSVRTTYAGQVATADQSAIYLTAVLAETQNGRVKEDVARQLVDQNKRLEQLTAELNQSERRESQLDARNSALNSTLSGQSGEMDRQNAELERRNAELGLANAAVDFQKTLAKAQQQFSTDEAEVFQQGNNLVVRLKKIQFSSGRAEMPSGAVPLLNKVRDVAQELGPKALRIEGHTDAVGSEQINQQLSENRAETIAEYFSENGIDRTKMQTAGIGYSKPLATNKTSAGRAQNRRVDVIITPESATTE